MFSLSLSVACVASESGYMTGLSLAFDPGVLFLRPKSLSLSQFFWRADYYYYNLRISDEVLTYETVRKYYWTRRT